MVACPVCDHSRTTIAVTRVSLPVMQNVVYPTRAAAMAAPCARFELSVCHQCGFAFNSAFDPSLAVYDESYDNDVPSEIFRKYYAELCSFVIDQLTLEDGLVIDVGCGKGTFLEVLCKMAPAIRGLGIDPSCQEVERANFKLIRSTFAAEHFVAQPRLVLLRHVLEHIPSPMGFLRALREVVPARARLFVEVPELSWITSHRAFWDFCYEHCNYFT
ncbi:MAG TPA: class I SAM-dependent methyltransferase, partial [Polyangia bacterium]